jgi:FHS family glucose/mannose:H+ symporter-like MFS transporter
MNVSAEVDEVKAALGPAPAAIPLYLGFAATGVGVALPGALLPALMMRWHLGDEQGGRLFLMAWIGSSLGALLVRGSLRTLAAVGSVAVACASLGLAFCAGHFADEWMGLYGLGLGMTMTSISLIRQQQATQSGVEMVRLNLLWAVGACVCPSLTVRALTAGAIQPLLFGLAGCFALLAGWVAMHEDVRLLPAGFSGAVPAWRVFWAVPAGLILMTVLITGIEASAGGWLATYARRGGHGIGDTIAAPTCFWAGLLLSRLFWSIWHGMRQAAVVRVSLALMGAASVLLIATGLGWMVLAAAFCLGFGIGPTYPLLLCWALRFQRGGAIFFLAGVGSACLPWLTGVISAQQGSLRLGLTVPMVGTMVMLLVAITRPLALWSEDGSDRGSGRRARIKSRKNASA